MPRPNPSTFVIGADAVIGNIEKLEKQIQAKVQKEINATGRRIISKAKAKASKVSGDLAQSIVGEPKLHSFIIEALADYAAYVEFGTGTEVFQDDGFFDQHPELKKYAEQYKRNPESGVNLKPNSFLFPAFFEEAHNMMKRLQGIANRAI